MSDQEWFVPLAGDDGVALFCLPHAGAGCAQLVPFAKAAAAHGLSVWSANLPGRQGRRSETPISDCRQLVDELVEDLLRRVDRRPYALFGYCGGALLAFEILRSVLARGAPMPTRLVVASYDAPDIAWRPRRIAQLPADALWEHLLAAGGIPAGLAAEPRMRALTEAAIRADFTLLGAYRYRPGPALPVPITVCYGEQDPHVQRGAMLGWRRHTTFPVELRGLPAGHWLLDEAPEQLAELTAAATVEALAADPA
ncbi:thioesterase II family protein [Cryptosporangium sp. NPDC051539]|uniref:thioesterase II family protein n=1 Tax=Cryptosporangium sp. NPDC051539 TaxID=3363962 RepID=UPI0037BA1240